MGWVILMLMHGFGWFYYWIPRPMRRFLGNLLGDLLRLFRVREKVVRQNLEMAFPGDQEQQARIFRASYQHLGNLILEIFLLFGPMRRFVTREVKVSGGENWQKAHALGKGVFFLASHVGNWEIMSAAGAVQLGMNPVIVTKHLKPEWLHRAIEKSRRTCGVGATYEPKTLRDMLAHLKTGGIVGVVLDQYAGPPIGVRVPVFGVPVGTISAVAMMAKRTGAPVLPVLNYRQPDGSYQVEVRPPILWEDAQPEAAIAINTARYAAFLEKDILAHPEQWLWVHRRFKGDLSPIRDGEWLQSRLRK